LADGDIDEVSRTELLLADIRDIFGEPKVTEISSATLIERLCAIVPRPWAEYGRTGKPITQNKLARLLKPLGIITALIGDDRLRGYRRWQFEDAFERYVSPSIPPSNRSPTQNQEKTDTYDLFQTAHPENRRADWNPAKSSSHNEMSDRADWNGGPEKHAPKPDGDGLL
jgi:hypothetical protein